MMLAAPKPSSYPMRNHRSTRRSRWLWLVVAICCTGGCVADARRIGDARDAYARGDLAEARRKLELLSRQRKYREVAELDLVLLDMNEGRFDEATRRLRQVRQTCQDGGDDAAASTVASMLTDDRQRRYRVAVEEMALIETLMAICSLQTDGIDASSHALRAVGHLTGSPTAKAVPTDRRVALAPYVRGLIREANHRDYEDAGRAYAQVAAIQSDFAPIGQDIARAGGGVHSRPGHGVLYVFAFVGRGAELRPTTAATTTEVLAAASAAFSVWQQRRDADGSKNSNASDPLILPNIASVQVPTVYTPPPQIASVLVSVDHSPVGFTQTLSDLTEVAKNRLADEMPAIMTRAVLRRMIKEASVAATTDGMGLEGNAASLARFATSSAWAAAEKPDLRCWSFLPATIQVMRLELPVGDHTIGFQSKPSIAPEDASSRVSIEDGRNSYRLVFGSGPSLRVVEPSESPGSHKRF